MADQKNDAEVVVGISGHDKIVAAAQSVSDAWRKAAKGAGDEVKAFGRAVKSEFGDLARSVASTAFQAQRINFTAGAESARTFGLAFNRYAAAAGKDAQALQAQLTATGKAALLPDEQVLSLAQAIRGVSYDAGFAADSVKQVALEASAMDRTPEQVAPLAGAIKAVWKEAGSATGGLKEVRGVVEQFKPSGGLASVHDQLMGIAGAASRTNLTLKESAGLVASFGQGGKWSEAQRQGAAGGIIGSIAQNRRWWEAYIRGAGLGKGRDFLLDKETGETDAIRAITLMQQAVAKKSGGKNDRYLEMMRWQFGDIEGTMLAKFDADKYKAGLAAAKPSDDAATRMQRLMQSDGARRTAAYYQQQRNARDIGGTVHSTRWDEFAAQHPILGDAATRIGSAASSTLGTGTLAAAGGWLAGQFGLKGAAAIAGGGAKLAGGYAAAAAPWIAAGGAGLYLGTSIASDADNAWNITDWLSGTGKHSRIAKDADAEFAASRKARAVAEWQTTYNANMQQFGGAAPATESNRELAGMIREALSGMEARIVQSPDGTAQKVVVGKSGTAQL